MTVSSHAKYSRRAVSYTHLDVYKRQPLGSGPSVATTGADGKVAVAALLVAAPPQAVSSVSAAPSQATTRQRGSTGEVLFIINEGAATAAPPFILSAPPPPATAAHAWLMPLSPSRKRKGMWTRCCQASSLWGCLLYTSLVTNH